MRMTPHCNQLVLAYATRTVAHVQTARFCGAVPVFWPNGGPYVMKTARNAGGTFHALRRGLVCGPSPAIRRYVDTQRYGGVHVPADQSLPWYRPLRVPAEPLITRDQFSSSVSRDQRYRT